MRIIGALLLLVVMGGCDLASHKDPIIVPDVEDEFYIDLWEKLAPAGRSLIVKVESIEKESCLNYRIDYTFIRKGNNLKVSLNNLIKPADCIDGEASVKADVDAGSLAWGNYGFDIDFKGLVVNNGNLNVNGESYLLTMKSEHGIVLLRDELMRVPDGALWGYIAYQQPDDEALANDFVTELSNMTKPALNYSSGYYGHFTISPLDGKVFVYNQPSTSYVKTFLYQYTGADEALKNLVANYRQNYGDRINIKLLNANGIEF